MVREDSTCRRCLRKAVFFPGGDWTYLPKAPTVITVGTCCDKHLANPCKQHKPNVIMLTDLSYCTGTSLRSVYRFVWKSSTRMRASHDPYDPSSSNSGQGIKL